MDPAAEPNDSGAENTPTLTDAELASIEVGQRGLSDPPNPNALPSNDPQRPEGVPEQFWKDGKVDVEGLARSYAELRSKMDSGKPDPAPTEDPAPDADGTDADGVKIGDQKQEEGKEGDEPKPSPIADAMEAARQEWAETQELSEDTFASLEAQGIPRPIVESYLEGVRLQQAQIEKSIYDAAGGKEAYHAAIKWASKALSADEIAKFDEALDDAALRETAVSGLMARYQKANPSEGRIVTPNDSPAANGDVFQSRDELVAAQKDPRYATDAAYRQSVIDKLARSQGAGFAAFERPLFAKQAFSN